MGVFPTGFGAGLTPTGFPGVATSLSGNTAGTSGSAIVLAGGNNITLSQSGNTISIIGGAGGGGGGIDVSLSGNTTGTLALVSTGTLILAGGPNITLSQNGQSVSISAGAAGAFTAGISGGNTAGNSGTVSNQVVFAGGNNITLSGSTAAGGETITISAFNQTVQTQNLIAASLSGNTAGALALVSSGTLILAGGNNITLSQNGQSVTISEGMGTVSQWGGGPPGLGWASALSANIGFVNVAQFWPREHPGFYSASAALAYHSLSISTSGTANSTGNGTISWTVGIFTKNVSTLSLASSGSVSFTWSYTSTQSTAQLQGLKALAIPINVNITPGKYWYGAMYSSASAGNLGGTGNVILQQIYANAGNSGFLGSAFSSSQQLMLGFGEASATTAAFPSSIAFSDMQGSGARGNAIPQLWFVNETV